MSILDGLGLSAYSVDRKLAKAFAGVVISKADFKTYSTKLMSLKDRFGNAKKIHNTYWGYGTPSEQSVACAANDILSHMKDGMVVLDINKEENKAAVAKLTCAMNSFVSNDWFVFEPIFPYNQHPKVYQAVKDAKALLAAREQWAAQLNAEK